MGAANILVVDDEPSVLRYTKTLLEVEDYAVETAQSGTEALRRMSAGLDPNLIVLDLVMPGMDGLQTLEKCRQIRPDQKVLMMSCCNEPSKIVQAMKLGAFDYLSKPFQPPQLRGAVRRIVEINSKAASPNAAFAVKDPVVIENLDDDLFFLAASPVMKQIHAQIALVARVDVPVLLLGESGVGKEVLARLIHKMSGRARQPLVKINCAALPADLLESELFGYEAGAFTGATSSKPGKFELANTGTIFLDEIGEMSAALQAKLLHVLQDGRFARLGSRSSIATDARVLAATNIDVQRAIAESKLREDLYYRLNAFTMTVPPLRERREEIPLLLNYYMNNLAATFGKFPLRISEQLIDLCLRYRWPGNLRELGNLVKRYLVLEDERLILDELRAKCQDEDLGSGQSTTFSLPRNGKGLKALVRSLKDEAEAKEILRVLEDTNWDRKLAAGALNISYKALSYKIKQYRISPREK
jgi:DNA-binding NtrC family response regulator